MFRLFHISLLLVAGACLTPFSASAQTPDEILAALKNDAQSSAASFQGFSAVRGERFFKQTHGNELSCASYHTDSPVSPGKHAKTGKQIKALAPAANAERFTDIAKVKKWFKRNCNDVLDRVCTPQEKGDVLTYLLTVKQ